jgi:hypothetical protein
MGARVGFTSSGLLINQFSTSSEKSEYMRRIAMVMLCLSALGYGQSTYSGEATWNGGGVLGTGYLQGSAGSDLPLPDFTVQGGVPLSLPQSWVDPMEPFVQSVDQTIYVGTNANGCPTNTPTSACTYYTGDSSGKNPLQEASDNWCALSGGSYDQRWDVVVTHGTTYNFGSTNPWTWCTKYNATAPTEYLVFHSDCTAASPCTGTNDLGYNPMGRQVCSHGINDVLSPPIPSMGQRNHGCQGYLGFPSVGYAVPIDNGAYTYDANYNDLGNMFTITSNINIGASQIIMGAASTQGGASGCGGTCPAEGVNHIWLSDAHFVTGQNPSNGGRTNTPVSIRAAEWTGSLLPVGWLGATPNHIGLSQVYIEGSTNDDGFGSQKIQRAIYLSCSYCSLTHSYIDGLKSDGKENHGISTDDAPGPVMVVDDWCEGSSGCYWGGGGSTPAIAGLDGTNIEFRRNRLPYEQRWMPAPAGNQTISKNVSGGSCAGTTLNLTIPNGITNQTAVYLDNIDDAAGAGVCGGGTNDCTGWYAATLTIGTTTNVAVTVSACSAAPASGKVYGWANNFLGAVNVVSAAALTSAGYDATMNNPVLKNRWESKDYKQILADGIIIENSAVDGQSGEGILNGVRGYSGVAYDSGGETATIQDLTLTNFIIRHSTEGMNLAARSGGYSLGTYSVTNAACNGTTSAVVTATGLNNAMSGPPNYLPDYSLNCSGSVCAGADVYLAGIGSGLIPDGWYTTSYPTQGNYGKDTTVTIWQNQAHTGTVCTVNNGTTTTGTVYGVKGSNGNGVSKAARRIVYQNGLLYGLGDHGLSNGAGNVNFGGAGGAGNNYAMQVTVNSDGVTATAVSQHINVCAASDECPRVLQAQVGDLAYMVCPNDDRFDAVDANNSLKGTPMLSVSADQLSFTYTLNAANHGQLTPGQQLTCPLAPPTSSTLSGYYNWQSFPWPLVLNHLTAVGVSGFNWGLGAYNPYNTFTNSIQVVPGPNDIAANDNCSGGTSTNCKYGLTGGVIGVETYSPTDQSGITYGNDRNTMTLKSWTISTRNVHNYLTFPCGSPGNSGCDTGGNPATAGTNSAPPNVVTSGSVVTCNNGQTCNSTNYVPDSVGFLGSMSTTTYPFLLTDWRNYALHSSSPYHAGNILDATDALDNGAQIPLIVNALSRTKYTCPLNTNGQQLSCGTGPQGDGPQYGFLQWSPYVGAVNYRVYRDGGTTPAGMVTTAWFNDYGLASGIHTWTVKAWDGAAEHVVTGLVSQIY